MTNKTIRDVIEALDKVANEITLSSMARSGDAKQQGEMLIEAKWAGKLTCIQTALTQLLAERE